MKTYLLMLVFISTAFIATSAFCNEINGRAIIELPAIVCDGVQRTATWKADKDTKILEIKIWNGLDFGTVADVIEAVYRRSDGNIFIMGNHDDYTQGAGGERWKSQSWFGHTVTVQRGDALDFVYGCNPSDITKGYHGAWSVFIWSID